MTKSKGDASEEKNMENRVPIQFLRNFFVEPIFKAPDLRISSYIFGQKEKLYLKSNAS